MSDVICSTKSMKRKPNSKDRAMANVGGSTCEWPGVAVSSGKESYIVSIPLFGRVG